MNMVVRAMLYSSHLVGLTSNPVSTTLATILNGKCSGRSPTIPNTWLLYEVGIYRAIPNLGHSAAHERIDELVAIVLDAVSKEQHIHQLTGDPITVSSVWLTHEFPDRAPPEYVRSG